jgi:methionine-S-sulfoxide reductase
MDENQKIILGGGCFWCLEATYQLINGVVKVVSGYAGDTVDKPNYEQVSSGKTKFAEVVEVTFSPTILRLEDILNIFWTIHNPTTLNRQGSDIGTQYRSIIFYVNESQLQTVETSKASAQKLWDNKIVTAVEPIDTFWPAEDYHQNYFNNNPGAAYCQLVINPKLSKLKNSFAHLLKTT